MRRRALVLGLGKSGASAAKLLLGEGAAVTAVDRGTGEGLHRTAAELVERGAEVTLECGRLPVLGGFDVCVVSPGIPAASEWVRDAEARGIETISELELGSRRLKCRMLAVTGSNGKSTMVRLCADALTAAGLRTAQAGNCGPALCEIVGRSGDLDWVVIEVSSFQLELVRDFRPDVAVLMNIYPNHLDRHGGMETYVETKLRIFARMGESRGRESKWGAAIVPEADADMAAADVAAPRLVTFGRSEKADYRYCDGSVRWISAGARETISLKGTLFANDVMGLTAAGGVACVRACGAESSALADAARLFEGLPHRMQTVADARGVLFVDDSKGTNLAAMRAALSMCSGPVRLIAGGVLKEQDLKTSEKTLAEKVKKAYLIGASARALAEAWGSTVECSRCGELAAAVDAAWRDAATGDTILLSPGCASFDQFRNFEDRGEQFARIARSLASDGENARKEDNSK